MRDCNAPYSLYVCPVFQMTDQLIMPPYFLSSILYLMSVRTRIFLSLEQTSKIDHFTAPLSVCYTSYSHHSRIFPESTLTTMMNLPTVVRIGLNNLRVVQIWVP